MKKLLSCFCVSLLGVLGVSATPLFSDNFDSYTTGANLVGQGPWLQTSTATATPIQVNASHQVAIGASGQDAYATLPGGVVTINNGDTLYMGLDINVASVANTSGDYFLHWSDTAGNTGTFIDRLYVKASGAGYVLGWAGSSGANAYGSGVLSFGTTYRVVTAYTSVTGAANDTGAVYETATSFDPVQGNNTAYLTSNWTAGSEASPYQIAEVNLRQGTLGPVLVLDNLSLSETWSDVAIVPEPATLSLLGGFGLLAWSFIRRRK